MSFFFLSLFLQPAGLWIFYDFFFHCEKIEETIARPILCTYTEELALVGDSVVVPNIGDLSVVNIFSSTKGPPPPGARIGPDLRYGTFRATLVSYSTVPTP